MTVQDDSLSDLKLIGYEQLSDNGFALPASGTRPAPIPSILREHPCQGTLLLRLLRSIHMTPGS